MEYSDYCRNKTFVDLYEDMMDKRINLGLGINETKTLS